MRQLVVEAELRGDAAGVLSRQRGELFLESVVAGPEQRELHLALHHLRQRLREDVVTLLVREAADGSAEQRVGILVEAQLLLQRELAGRLSREIPRRVALRDGGIRLRAPALVV